MCLGEQLNDKRLLVFFQLTYFASQSSGVVVMLAWSEMAQRALDGVSPSVV